MVSYEEFLRTAAVPRETIDRFLDDGAHCRSVMRSRHAATHRTWDSPAGNHFFAHSLRQVVVDWLDPKPITYRGETPTSIDFTGYLPDTATDGLR